MIYRHTNPLTVPKLVDLCRVVPGTPIEAAERLLIAAVLNDDARVFVDEKEGQVKGFIFGSIEQWEGQPVVYIQFCVVKPDERHTCHELLGRIEAWAKERGIDQLIFVTMRDPKSFIRKYHFSFEGTVLKRSVKHE